MPCSRYPGGSVPGVSAPGVWSGDTPPPVTATAAGGTHPTGMHSCFCDVCHVFFDIFCLFLDLFTFTPD